MTTLEKTIDAAIQKWFRDMDGQVTDRILAAVKQNGIVPIEATDKDLTAWIKEGIDRAWEATKAAVIEKTALSHAQAWHIAEALRANSIT